MIIVDNPTVNTKTMNAATPLLIQKEVLRDKISDVVKRWILDGTLKPGEHLVETTLAKQLNVSRAPLREALWLLSRQGLVHIRAHHGATVTEFSEQSIRELFEVREVLEIHAAKRIRKLLSPSIIAALNKAVRTLEKAAEAKDIQQFSVADLEFHKTLWQLAGNAHLLAMLEELSTRFFAFVLIRDTQEESEFEWGKIVELHRSMVRLILEGTEKEIESGFKKSFAEFLENFLTRTAAHRPSSKL